LNRIAGYRVYLAPEAVEQPAAFGEAVALLGKKLIEIGKLLPPGPLAKLSDTTFWLDWDDKRFTGLVYHPSADWLKANNYDPLMAGGVHIGNVRNFVEWVTLDQPMAVLHELAHARRRDPLRCWLVELIVWSLWFPRTAWLGGAHRAARESGADALAAAAMGDDRPLLRALLKVDTLSPIPGSCGLTSERERALRQVRHHGLTVGPGERAGLILGLSLVAAMMFVAFAGLSDWQSYWFCPDGISM